MKEIELLEEIRNLKKNLQQIFWVCFSIFFALTVSSFKIDVSQTYSDMKSLLNDVHELMITDSERAALKSEAALKSYKNFLQKDQNKAFAISSTGGWYFVYGRFGERDAVYTALLRCNDKRFKSEPPCQILNINGKVQDVSFGEK